jgi:protein-tyrosine phosphatase
MHYVTESLLIGNVEDAQSPPASIGAVLFLSAEHTIEPPPGVDFAHVPLKEYGEAEPNDVLKAVDWMEEHAPGQRLMVCCRAGIGRSVSIIIAYLCCVQGMPYEEAVKLLKARRPGATPLPLLEQTIESVRQLRDTRATQSSGSAHPDHPFI